MSRILQALQRIEARGPQVCQAVASGPRDQSAAHDPGATAVPEVGEPVPGTETPPASAPAETPSETMPLGLVVGRAPLEPGESDRSPLFHQPAMLLLDAPRDLLTPAQSMSDGDQRELGLSGPLLVGRRSFAGQTPIAHAEEKRPKEEREPAVCSMDLELTDAQGILPMPVYGTGGPLVAPEPVSRELTMPEPDKSVGEQEPRAAPASVESQEPRVETVRSPEDEIQDLLGKPVEEDEPGFRALSANVLSQLPRGRSAAILFTSPGDHEGKTATLAALAAILAEGISGGVVAVDCNVHRPDLAAQVGLSTRRGLADVLSGSTRWQEAVRSTALDGLRVLPGVPVAEGGQPAVDWVAMEPLLDELRRQYRLVLLDGASLTQPEVAPLARVCDGTYLVVRLGQTTRRAAVEAIRTIQGAGGRVLGCVVTNAPPVE
jgi:Mrp family chromosome partitioning ATPase